MEKVKEIKRIAQIPIEIFVHGALCVSYSGNCLMSGLIGYRSGNRGRCVGSCRKPYELIDTTTGKSLGESYILSTKDLNTIDYIEDLKEIDSLKIEGRMKTEYYVSHVVNAYRRAIDKSAPLELLEEELGAISHRPYNSGFYFGELVHNHKNDGLYHWDCTFAGVALDDCKDGKLLIQQKNFFKLGDTVEVLSPDSFGMKFTATKIVNEKGEECESACHPQEILTLDCDAPVKKGDILRIRTAKQEIITNI
jgi:collagenase-like PrtC family protease